MLPLKHPASRHACTSELRSSLTLVVSEFSAIAIAMAELFIAVDFCLFAYMKKRELPTVASPFIGVQCTRDKRRIMFGARVRSSVG